MAKLAQQHIKIMKKTLLVLFFWIGALLHAQSFKQNPPVFPNCSTVEGVETQRCFDREVQLFIFQNFKAPEQFKGTVTVVFEVNEKGAFLPLFIDAAAENVVK